MNGFIGIDLLEWCWKLKKNNLIFLGAIKSTKWIDNDKELSRNFHQGYRVYDSVGISNTISSNSIGGLGGHSGLYLVIEK